MVYKIEMMALRRLTDGYFSTMDFVDRINIETKWRKSIEIDHINRQPHKSRISKY